MPGKALFPQVSTSLSPATSNHLKSSVYFNDGTAGGSYCNVDIFEEASNFNVDIFEEASDFNNGDNKDWNFNDGPGVCEMAGSQRLVY